MFMDTAHLVVTSADGATPIYTGKAIDAFPFPAIWLSSSKLLYTGDGKILTTLPLAGGSDGAVFNPHTMEAFSSHGNGTLSVIKENSPTEFVLKETVKTKPRAKTCALDTKTDHVIVITREGGGGRQGGGGPATLDVMFIGR